MSVSDHANWPQGQQVQECNKLEDFKINAKVVELVDDVQDARVSRRTGCP
jgi:hypothetical protein